MNILKRNFYFSSILYPRINIPPFSAISSIVTSISARICPFRISLFFLPPSVFLLLSFRLRASVSRWTCQFSSAKRVKRSAGIREPVFTRLRRIDTCATRPFSGRMSKVDIHELPSGTIDLEIQRKFVVTSIREFTQELFLFSVSAKLSASISSRNHLKF